MAASGGSDSSMIGAETPAPRSSTPSPTVATPSRSAPPPSAARAALHTSVTVAVGLHDGHEQGACFGEPLRLATLVEIADRSISAQDHRFFGTLETSRSRRAPRAARVGPLSQLFEQLGHGHRKVVGDVVGRDADGRQH